MKLGKLYAYHPKLDQVSTVTIIDFRTREVQVDPHFNLHAKKKNSFKGEGSMPFDKLKLFYQMDNGIQIVEL